MRKKTEQTSGEYSHKPMQHRVIAGFVITIILIFAISIVSFRSLNQLKDLVKVIDTPDELNNELFEVLNLLNEEELLLKEFFTTRNPKHIDEYKAIKDSINLKIKRLAYLLGTDSTSMNNLIEMTKLIDQKHELFNTWFEYYASDTMHSEYFEILARVDSLRQKLEKERTAHIPDSVTEDGAHGKIRQFFQRLKGTVKNNTAIDSSFATRDSIYLTLITEMSELENVISQEMLKSEDQSIEQQKMVERLFQRNFLLTAEIRTSVDNIVEIAQQREMLQKQLADSQFLKETKIVGGVIILTLVLITILIFIIFRDLKHIEKHKNALVIEKNSATKLAELKSRFLSNMSHEIRTPLTSIIGYAEQLKKKLKDQSNKEFVEIIYKSSEHLLFLVNEILTFSRLEAKKITLDKVPFNMQDILEDVYEILKLKADEKKLDFRLYANVQSIVEGDPQRLKQILINLIGNAIKFTDKGRVEFGAYVTDEQTDKLSLRFFVRDTGIGIPDEKAKYIFEEFSQAYKESYGKYGGTGLGLSICKQLIDLHGGTIDIYSKPTEGTEIVFSIVYKIAPETADKMIITPEITKDNGTIEPEKTSVLIVDDDEFIAMLGQQILKDHGFVVDVAHTGNEGLNKINEKAYHLLLLDINLPDISGYEVMSALKEQHLRHLNGNMRVVALTANAINLPEDKLTKLGFHGKFIKPFHENELVRFVFSQIQIAENKG